MGFELPVHCKFSVGLIWFGLLMWMFGFFFYASLDQLSSELTLFSPQSKQ